MGGERDVFLVRYSSPTPPEDWSRQNCIPNLGIVGMMVNVVTLKSWDYSPSRVARALYVFYADFTIGAVSSLYLISLRVRGFEI